MAAIHLSRIEFSDEYFESIRSARPVTMEDILVASTTFVFPWWITFLMTTRDWIVGWFGLKTSKQIKATNRYSFGLFPILARSGDEVIAGEDDRHLNFRVVIRLIEDASGVQRVAFRTLVQFNNTLGRIYFIPVKPIHKVIVPALLRRLSRQLAVK